MKKKIFIIIGSLGAGGSERVYWILAQYFNRSEYDVIVVTLNGKEQCFSKEIDGIKFIDLESVRASRSFFKLYHILQTEKPYAVFSTTDHINILTGAVACFLKVPNLIARASNDPQQMKQFYGYKARFYNLFTRVFSYKFDFIVCQSEEMKQSIVKLYGINLKKLKVISNPILPNSLIKNSGSVKNRKLLIAVGRLVKEKGLFRLLETFKMLPSNYRLTIVGDGPLMNPLKNYVYSNDLEDRVAFLGEVNDVSSIIVKHDLLVHSSFTEGFPNVILEALSVGVPVVTFQVGGVNDLITSNFNGYVAEQGDMKKFRECIIEASGKSWLHQQIKDDAYSRFNLNVIGKRYENLLFQ